jgi:uncharacterized membrane protein YciS (DUF1049 family)
MQLGGSIGLILSSVDMWVARNWTRHRLSSFIPLGWTVGLCAGWLMMRVLGYEKIKRIVARMMKKTERNNEVEDEEVARDSHG